MEIGHHTRQEIFSQPKAWSAALDVLRAQSESLRAFYREGQFDTVLFTACGSPYYLGLSAAALMNELGGPGARCFPASEVWLNPRLTFRKDQRTLLITVSRSGETSETVRAVETFRGQGNGAVLTLTINPGSALTTLGDVNLVLPSGLEESIAQTRAFTTLYLSALYLAAFWSGRDDILSELPRLPAASNSLISNSQSLAQSLGHDPSLDRFYFLGSGARYGLACELSLKMKEMSLSHSEPFHFLEFRHGPKSMASRGALVIGLVSESNRQPEMAVLDDTRALGARVIALNDYDADVAFGSGLSEIARNILYLPFGQLFAFERALSKNLNPDKPENLDAFVVLK